MTLVAASSGVPHVVTSVSERDQPLGSPPPASSAASSADSSSQIDILALFADFITTHKLSKHYQNYLQVLCKYHVVILADDSGSMDTRPSIDKPTRWEDLAAMLGIAIDAASIFDTKGADVHFLNRDPIMHVKNKSQLQETFAKTPGEYDRTPLIAKMRKIFELYTHSDKPILFIIATDGVPSDFDQQVDNYDEIRRDPQLWEKFCETNLKLNEEGFNKLMLEREANPLMKEKFKISFLMTTDEQPIVDFYDGIKKEKTGVDVTENYDAELEEMLELYGPDFVYTKADWVIKMLLGAIVPEIGNIDVGKANELAPLAQQQAESQVRANQVQLEFDAQERMTESKRLEDSLPDQPPPNSDEEGSLGSGSSSNPGPCCTLL